MSSILSDIYKFNKEAGFLDGTPMDSFKETAYILEEALEGFEGAFNASDKDGNLIKPGDKDWATARQWSLSFMNQILAAYNNRPDLEMPSEVAEFDKAIDGIWFNIGKLAKMNLTEDQVERGFAAVAQCNLAKIGGPKDDLGKQLKPEGWAGPEDKLQDLLDERENNIKAPTDDTNTD